MSSDEIAARNEMIDRQARTITFLEEEIKRKNEDIDECLKIGQRRLHQIEDYEDAIKTCIVALEAVKDTYRSLLREEIWQAINKGRDVLVKWRNFIGMPLGKEKG